MNDYSLLQEIDRVDAKISDLRDRRHSLVKELRAIRRTRSNRSDNHHFYLVNKNFPFVDQDLYNEMLQWFPMRDTGAIDLREAKKDWGVLYMTQLIPKFNLGMANDLLGYYKIYDPYKRRKK